MAKSKNVLIIDDDSDDIEIFSAVLLEIDPSIQIDAISDSTTALAELCDGSKPHPDFILLDINMPKMDGIQATAHIKARYPSVLVLGISINADDEYRDAMVRAGAISLISKQVAINQLHEAIVGATRRA